MVAETMPGDAALLVPETALDALILTGSPSNKSGNVGDGGGGDENVSDITEEESRDSAAITPSDSIEMYAKALVATTTTSKSNKGRADEAEEEQREEPEHTLAPTDEQPTDHDDANDSDKLSPAAPPIEDISTLQLTLTNESPPEKVETFNDSNQSQDQMEIFPENGSLKSEVSVAETKQSCEREPDEVGAANEPKVAAEPATETSEETLVEPRSDIDSAEEEDAPKIEEEASNYTLEENQLDQDVLKQTEETEVEQESKQTVASSSHESNNNIVTGKKKWSGWKLPIRHNKGRKSKQTAPEAPRKEAEDPSQQNIIKEEEGQDPNDEMSAATISEEEEAALLTIATSGLNVEARGESFEEEMIRKEEEDQPVAPVETTHVDMHVDQCQEKETIVSIDEKAATADPEPIALAEDGTKTDTQLKPQSISDGGDDNSLVEEENKTMSPNEADDADQGGRVGIIESLYVKAENFMDAVACGQESSLACGGTEKCAHTCAVSRKTADKASIDDHDELDKTAAEEATPKFEADTMMSPLSIAIENFIDTIKRNGSFKSMSIYLSNVLWEVKKETAQEGKAAEVKGAPEEAHAHVPQQLDGVAEENEREKKPAASRRLPLTNLKTSGHKHGIKAKTKSAGKSVVKSAHNMNKVVRKSLRRFKRGIVQKKSFKCLLPSQETNKDVGRAKDTMVVETSI